MFFSLSSIFLKHRKQYNYKEIQLQLIILLTAKMY